MEANGHGAAEHDLYEKAVLSMLDSEPKQRKWLFQQLCPKIMSARKLQNTLNSLETAGDIKRVYKPIGGRATAWYTLPMQMHLLDLDAGRVLAAVERLTKLLYRPPTVDEIAVELGIVPAEAQRLAYGMAAQTGWFNPTPELVAYAREKLGEALFCGALIRHGVSEADLKCLYEHEPEIPGEAKRLLQEHPEMTPTLRPDKYYHPASWEAAWPPEALKRLGKPYKQKPRPIPGKLGALLPQEPQRPNRLLQPY